MDRNIIDIAQIRSDSLKFQLESARFNDKISVFSTSYFFSCGDPNVSQMKDKLETLYNNIQKGYTSIDEWWQLYIAEVVAVENALAGNGNSITEATIRGLANRLPELKTYVENISGDFDFQPVIVDGMNTDAFDISSLNSAEILDIQKLINLLLRAESISWANRHDLLPPAIGGRTSYKNLNPNHSMKIIDLESGIIFNAHYIFGSNHADIVPSTPADTELFFGIGERTLNRHRPVLVVYNDRVFKASINTKPHGTGLSDNGMNGHICLHVSDARGHRRPVRHATAQTAYNSIDGLIDSWVATLSDKKLSAKNTGGPGVAALSAIKSIPTGAQMERLTQDQKINWILNEYDLTEKQFNFIAAGVLAEAKRGENNDAYTDAYWVINSVYNRARDGRASGGGSGWSNYYPNGTNLYAQMSAADQYIVYSGARPAYRSFLNSDGSLKDDATESVRFQAILDFLTTREIAHNYVNFRASSSSAAGRTQSVPGGNRYFNAIPEEHRIMDEPVRAATPSTASVVQPTQVSKTEIKNQSSTQQAAGGGAVRGAASVVQPTQVSKPEINVQSPTVQAPSSVTPGVASVVRPNQIPKPEINVQSPPAQAPPQVTPDAASVVRPNQVPNIEMNVQSPPAQAPPQVTPGAASTVQPPPQQNVQPATPTPPPPASSSPPPSSPPPVTSGVHVVESGQNLTRIANMHNTTVDEILALNPDITNPNLIYPDQRINLPPPASSSPPPSSPPPVISGVHVVASGENLTRIANMHNTTVDKLLALNPDITNRDLIYPNQIINLP